MTKINKRGFSLIELLVVLSIMGILATVALPLTELAQRRNQEEDLRRSLREIRSAIDEYKRKFDEGRIIHNVGDSGYPPNLNSLVDGVVDVQSAKSEKIFFLRKLPKDPFAVTDTTGADQSWGLRSYASTASDPQPGRDVFDVYSKSNQVGLNGTPYNQW